MAFWNLGIYMEASYNTIVGMTILVFTNQNFLVIKGILWRVEFNTWWSNYLGILKWLAFSILYAT
jgi:hypothetical protein